MKQSRSAAFLSAALAFLSVFLPAARGAEVSSADAARAASAWVARGFAMGRLPAGRAVAGVDELAVPGSGALLRVVRFEGGGFVVLSADDSIEPVLAFSETGTGVEPDEANPFWALLQNDIAAREAAAGIVRGGTARAKRSSGGATSETTAAARAKWAALLADDGATVAVAQGVSAISDVRVEPFVRSKWSQSTSDNYSNSTNYCYNYHTPNHYVCGCTATAIAQIMRYWRFPTAPVAANSYPCAVAGSSVTKTMKGGVYDWDAMPLDPRNQPGLTEAQRQAIGKLCYDVGVTVEMEWDDDGSSSSLYAGVACLPIDFGYANAKAVNYGFGKNYDLDHFKLGVVPNLDARCPVGVSVTGAGGHSVVGDGYGYSDGDFFIHLNMGWAGQDNLWYAPPRLGTTSYAFNAISGYLFNVFPEKTGSIASGRVLDASGAPVAGATVALQKNGVTVDTATSDENGIYAFIASTGTYLVAASKDGAENSISVTLGTTTGTSITTTAGQRGYYSYGAGTIGNTYGNDIALTGMAAVPAPVFDPGDCLFYPATNVTISCADPDATISYTLDGSVPTETSAAYSGPIFVEDDVTIKARAFAPGKNPSPVVAATYTYDTAQGAPKGDYFANPIKISGANGTRVVGDNSEYTVEDDEPWHTLRPNEGGGYTYNYQYRTIWYQWTAPGTGTMTFRTSCEDDGYPWPTFVAVYVGDSLSSATRLAFSYDYSNNYVTSVDVDVEEGTEYRIVGMMCWDVDGAFTLSWSGDLVAAASPYGTWAEAHGLSGDPAERSNGVENAFRYVFGKPTEPFSPILGISSAPGGGIVLTLPPVANTDGVSLKLLSAAKVEDLDTANATERAIAPAADGTVVLGDGGAKGFYRLGADVAE